MAGYELYFIDYAFISPYYYSPQDITTHSLWAEYNWLIQKDFQAQVYGKIGYAPSLDYLLSELSCEFRYNPFPNLILSARLSYLKSFRYDSSYKAFSAFFSLYWNFL